MLNYPYKSQKNVNAKYRDIQVKMKEIKKSLQAPECMCMENYLNFYIILWHTAASLFIL